MTNYTRPDYNTLLNHELTELEARLKRRLALKQELERLSTEIVRRREGVFGLARLANADIRKTHSGLFKSELEAEVGLTDAIVEVFEDINQECACSPMAIREELECMGFPIHTYRNPEAAIINALNRMVDVGKLIVATDNDIHRTVYMWADGLGGHRLKRQQEDIDQLHPQYAFAGEMKDDSVDLSQIRPLP